MKSRNQHIDSVSLLTIIVKIAGPLKNIPFLPMLLDEQMKLLTFFFRPKRFLKMQELRRMVTEKLRLETGFHRFGGLEFRYQGKEIAHMHSNGLLDILFPRILSSLLIEKGVTGIHHVYPDSGWTSLMILGNTDVESCFALIQSNLLLHTGEIEVDGIMKRFENVPL